MGSGRHSTGRRSWWRAPRRSADPARPAPLPGSATPPTTPYGLPAIPAPAPSADQNTRWLIQKLGSDRLEAYQFILERGLTKEFRDWRGQ